MKRCGWCRLPFEASAVVLVLAALFVAPQPATAQHGGSGGHAGGGGGHSGGSGHFAGFGFGGSHGRFSSSSSSSHKSATNSTHALHAEPLPPLVTARPAASSVAAVTKERTPFHPAPEHTTIGFPPEPPSRFPTAPLHSSGAGPLSFSGEGHQIWQNTPSHLTTAATPATMMRPQPPHIIRPPGFPYYPAWFFPAYGFYGFSPFFGWDCSPFYSWTLGCGGFGYGYGFGGYYPQLWDQSEPPVSDDVSNEPSPSLWQNPPAGEEGNAVVSIPQTVIYLQDGSSYQVTDYWFSDNRLHYVTNYGGENSVRLSQIDVQRTVDANAERGVEFTLHPAPPPSLTPPPSADSAPPATPPQ